MKLFSKRPKRTLYSSLLFWISMSSLTPCIAMAGKVEDVKKMVKDSCNIVLKEEDLMDVVVKVYDCNPDSKVKIGVNDCVLRCMKPSGAIVGGGK